MTLVNSKQLDAVVEVLLTHHGIYAYGDPGEVLGNLAAEAGVPYKATSQCVLLLEQWGLVTVERLSHPEAHRANRIIEIRESP
jgi:hypothetical protein